MKERRPIHESSGFIFNDDWLRSCCSVNWKPDLLHCSAKKRDKYNISRLCHERNNNYINRCRTYGVK